jgi:hypothetical protein
METPAGTFGLLREQGFEQIASVEGMNDHVAIAEATGKPIG